MNKQATKCIARMPETCAEIHDDLARERDEARAEVRRLRRVALDLCAQLVRLGSGRDLYGREVLDRELVVETVMGFKGRLLFTKPKRAAKARKGAKR